jgi:hypothetical protein
MKNIESLINLDSIDKSIAVFADGGKEELKEGGKFSDSGGIMLARNLEKIDPSVIVQKRAGRVLLNTGITVDNSGGIHDFVSSLKRSAQGEFVDLGGNSDQDGKISMSMTKTSGSLNLGKTSHSEWSNIELLKAQASNINLPSNYMQETVNIYMNTLDDYGLFGVKDDAGTVQNAGLFDQYAVDGAYTLGAINFTTQTGLEIYTALSGVINRRLNLFSGNDELGRMAFLLPLSVLNGLSSAQHSPTSASISVLDMLKASFSTVEFYGTSKTENVGGVKKACLYSIDPSVSQFRITKPLEFSATFQECFKYKFESQFFTAGLEVLEVEGGAVIDV